MAANQGFTTTKIVPKDKNLNSTVISIAAKSRPTTMAAKPPSLVNLCVGVVKNYILNGDGVDGDLQGVYELPIELFDCLIQQLPALALHIFQLQMPSEKQSDFLEYGCSGDGRKRVRYGGFDVAWKALFYQRWPKIVEHTPVRPLVMKNASDCESMCDWQQKYWEIHLQNCFDAAAERAMLPSFNERIGEVEIPGALTQAIGCDERAKCSLQDYSRLSSHCKEFGSYIRCLRLQNVFCNAETCNLLANSKLERLVLRRIYSQIHGDGLCLILRQHKQTIKSLEFINCKITSAFVETICQSLCLETEEMHGIKHFAIRASRFLEDNPISLPPKFVTFISSRSLESLAFCEDHIRRNCAKLILKTLIDASSGLSILDLSDNNISSWLSDFRCEAPNHVLSPQDIIESLKSLSVLNLRGNNLQKGDMEDLRFALVRMPVLETLDLADNPIEDDGIQSLIPYFVNTIEKVPLKNLNLKNCKISSKGATELVELLSAIKYPLSYLSLADNELGSQIVPALGDFLRTSIRSLDIKDIGLGLSGLLEFRINLPDVVNLVSLDISENRGGIQAAEFLKDLIARSPVLLDVHAGYNLMPPESLNIICSSLEVGKGKLQLIDLSGNPKLFQPDHATALAEIQQSGGPTILIQSSSSQDALYDDDP